MTQWIQSPDWQSRRSNYTPWHRLFFFFFQFLLFLAALSNMVRLERMDKLFSYVRRWSTLAWKNLYKRKSKRYRLWRANFWRRALRWRCKLIFFLMAYCSVQTNRRAWQKPHFFCIKVTDARLSSFSAKQKHQVSTNDFKHIFLLVLQKKN